MNTHEAARRWAEVWETGWRTHDVEAIAALYGQDCVYRSHPFRPPNQGRAAAVAYLSRAFSTEQDPDPHLTVVAVEGDRAAVEWWCSALDGGRPVTLAGGSMVRFDGDGLVVQEHDYWNQVDAVEQPFQGWGWGG